MRRVSLAILINGDRLLLYLRDKKPEISYPDHWALLGGQVEAGETPLEAVAREIKEEIGSRASNLVFRQKIDVVGNPECDDHQIYLFTGNIDRRLNELRLTEGQKLGYFTVAEFLNLKFPAFLRPICLAILSDGSYSNLTTKVV
jgi:8-oxo-dGTP diphosphatase